MVQYKSLQCQSKTFCKLTDRSYLFKEVSLLHLKILKSKLEEIGIKVFILRLCDFSCFLRKTNN